MLTNSSFEPNTSQEPTQDPAKRAQDTSAHPSTSAFLLPSFQYIPPIPPEPSTIETFIKAFLLPSQLHPSHEQIAAYCNDISWSTDPSIPENHRGHGLDEYRREANFLITLRRIYRDHGWPDSFNREGCRRALEKFLAENDRFEKEIRRLVAFIPLLDHVAVIVA